MPIIWSRWGILVLPILFFSLLGTQAAVDWQFGDGFYTANAWPKAAACVLGALITGAVGFVLNRKERAWATKHRLLFLPMEYWAVVILVITGCITYGELTRISP